ncbi:MULTISPECIES: hypothetical protein [unclassified Streptomyces]|uniref:hypothetical protein n=1 Tax=unclassified Streptomyces TaxID=2593676 RepID=UPI0022B5FA68|nr:MULTISPECIES: hypothetical protein [unclassified Streptomyces]MCZ7414702.1 hypothetical protein [Streptomyces sp. WMMC897]MCZ7431631.1 hypothetical protein [Streptomyces sp. WMMC1477]
MSMHDPVRPATPTPYRQGPGGGALVVRVLFASFPVWSLGMLAWVPSLRFAVLRSRALDWAVFAGFLTLSVLEVVFALALEDEPEGSNVSAAAGGLVLVLIIGATVHAVLGDRFPRPPAPYPHHAGPYSGPRPGAAPGVVPGAVPPGYGPGAQPAAPPAPGYGYPQPPAVPLHQQPTLYAPPPAASPHTPPPASPHTPPPAPAPAAQGQPEPQGRMRQVASELDELDELLRKRDGR